jgi:hypothetical protein
MHELGAKMNLDPARQAVNDRTRLSTASSRPSTGGLWRCSFCGRLLGIVTGSVVQIKYSEKLDLTASRPITRQCPACRRVSALQ